MREFIEDDTLSREQLSEKLKEVLAELSKVPTRYNVVTVGDLRALIQYLPDEVTVWVQSDDGCSVSVPVRNLEISDCTMPDLTSEAQSIQLTIAKKDVDRF